MSAMPKPTVGQILYSLNVGNRARGVPQELTPVVVKSVGRKWFTVGRKDWPSSETRYSLEDWKEDAGGYCRNSVLYVSEQAWADDKELTTICHKIGAAFEYGQNLYDVSLPDVRKIHALIYKEAQP